MNDPDEVKEEPGPDSDRTTKEETAVAPAAEESKEPTRGSVEAAPPPSASPSPRFSRWDVIAGIAHAVIAIVAILGFWLSVRSSREVARLSVQASEQLESIAASFNTVTQPVLQVTRFAWGRGSQGIDCGHFPTEIQFDVTNVSQVPVRKYARTELRVAYGDSLLLVEAGPDSTDIVGPITIPPGQTVSSTFFVPGMSPIINSREGVLWEPPLIRVSLESEISRVGSSGRFLWKTKQALRFNCHNPGVIAWSPEADVLEQIPLD